MVWDSQTQTFGLRRAPDHVKHWVNIIHPWASVPQLHGKGWASVDL